MRILVTGAGGFVGRKLVSKLGNHEIIALDQHSDQIPQLPHITSITGDLCDNTVLETATAGGCDAVIHLATVPGGAAEQNPDLAKRVNLDATIALANAVSKSGNQPRFIFASSIAVFGNPLPASIDDTTPLTPTMLYGAHKAMIEAWLATLSRRGELEALSLRLSGVVARPKGPSGMKSAFMSDIFHALKNGESFVMPVSAQASCWVNSVDCVTDNIIHAVDADLDKLPPTRAITLPTLRIRIAELVTEIAKQSEQSTELVTYSPDAALEAAFGALPPVTTQSADAMGYTNDTNLEALVANTLQDLENNTGNLSD